VVNQLISDKEQLPSLPKITYEVRRALENPNLPLPSLGKLISKDPSLTSLIMKYASSSMQRTKPQNLMDALHILGIKQIERITMAHSVQSLFTIHSVQHKRLYIEAWNRVKIKTAISSYLAQQLNKVTADQALLGSLLSEIGSFAVLSAFKSSSRPPDQSTYVALCREYSKSLGLIMLKRWQLDDIYVDLIRSAGDWTANSGKVFSLSDLNNLSLFHSIKMRGAGQDLPSIMHLSAYKKLLPHQNTLSLNGDLSIVANNIDEILKLADELFE